MAKTEFFLASIATNPDKVGEYVHEAKQMGVDILPPDINLSRTNISIVNNQIYFGLHNVKNVGKQAADFLVHLRNKWGDFASREHLDTIIEDEVIFWEATPKGKSPKQKCSKGAIDSLELAGCFDNLQACKDLHERALLQKQLLGVSFVDVYTPLLEQYKNEIGKYLPLPTVEATQGLADGYGIISSVEFKRTRADAKPGFANREYTVFTVEWQLQSMSVTCFDSREFHLGEFWLIQVKINARGSTFSRGTCLNNK